MVTVRFHTQTEEWDGDGLTVADLVTELRQGLGDIEPIPAGEELAIFINGRQAEPSYSFPGGESVEVKPKAGVLA